jgi:hypothetical protein
VDANSIAFVVAAGGWVVALVTLLIGYIERRAARDDERLAKTLDYFDGGSQKRSIGISLVEGLWIHQPRFHSVLAPLIANQIVYLLLSTESRDPHNERNLVRMFMLFKSIPDLRTRYGGALGDVRDAIHEKYHGEKKGIHITRPTLQLWARELGFELADA